MDAKHNTQTLVGPLSFLHLFLSPRGRANSGEAPSNQSGLSVAAPHLREPGRCVLMLLLKEIVRHYFLRSNILAACSPLVARVRKLSAVYWNGFRLPAAV